MSNIIKAEYVVIDNSNRKQLKEIINTQPTQSKAITTPKEELYEIYNQREVILKEASEEALRIVNTAKRNAQIEISEYKKKGYEEGYNAGMEVGKNKGYNEGYEKGKLSVIEELHQKNQDKLKELAKMLKKVEEEKEEIILKFENDISKMAVEVAEKIIKQKINEKDNIISGIIKNVVKDYRNSEWIKIYVSSKDDIISVQADKDLINALNRISRDVKFEISEELEQGSAVVETPDNLVDASIDTQLKNLKEMVLSKNAV